MKKSRRDFLKLLSSYSAVGLSSGAFNTLFDILLGEEINAAFASEIGPSSNSKYLFIQEYAAPERWVFDLFLDPYNSGYLPKIPLEGRTGDLNRQIANAYQLSGGRLESPIYKFANVKGIKAPLLWGHDTSSKKSGSRPVADLLDNMLNIRGINAGNSIHTLATRLQAQPGVGGPTLTGMMADSGNAPISAVSFNGVYSPYQSQTGKGRLILNSNANTANDLIAQIKKPFINSSPYIQTGNTNDLLLKKIESFESTINNSLSSTKNMSSSSAASLKGAKDLMFEKFDSMIGKYPELFAKYENLISRSIPMVIPGVNNAPVGSANNRSRGNQYHLHGMVVGEPDLRNLVLKNKYSGGSNAHLTNMADMFAVAEFVMLNNLSNSIQVRMVPWLQLRFQQLSNANLSTRIQNQSFDAHAYGSRVNIQLMTTYYRALAACLLELIDRLKENNLFNDSIIHLGGEFNRAPRKNASGSDHAGYAVSASLFSGKIQGPNFIGNIKTNSHSVYDGLYGKAALGPDKREISLGSLSSTIATIMDVPSPSPNNSSLVSMKDGKVSIAANRKASNLKEDS